MYKYKLRAIENQIESQSSQDSEAIHNLAKTNIARSELMVNIINNGYTDPSTLEFIATYYCDLNNNVDKSIRRNVLINLARRKDLTVKAAHKLVHIKSQMVAREMSKTTQYEIIQKLLIKRNSKDEIVIGNVMRATRNLDLVSKCINMITEDDETSENSQLVKTSNYILIGIYFNQNLTEGMLNKLIDAKKIIPSRLMCHKNFTKNVFEHLVKTVSWNDLTSIEGLTAEIAASPYVEDYPQVFNVIVFSRRICTEDVIAAFLSNLSLSRDKLNLLFKNFMSIIVNNKKMLTKALERSNSEEEILKFFKASESIYGCHITTVHEKNIVLSNQTYELISEKLYQKDYPSMSAYTKYVPVNYWNIVYNRVSIKNSTYMLEKEDCPKEILAAAASTCRYFPALKAVVTNPNTDLKIAINIFDRIKYAETMPFDNRVQIWKLLEKRFKTRLTDILLNRKTTDRELYYIYTLSSNLDLKCKIAMRIKGVSLQYIINNTEIFNSQLAEALLQNPELSSSQKKAIKSNYHEGLGWI